MYLAVAGNMSGIVLSTDANVARGGGEGELIKELFVKSCSLPDSLTAY